MSQIDSHSSNAHVTFPLTLNRSRSSGSAALTGAAPLCARAEAVRLPAHLRHHPAARYPWFPPPRPARRHQQRPPGPVTAAATANYEPHAQGALLPGEPRESRLQGGRSGVWAAEVALTGALWLGDVPQPRRTCGWPAAAQQRSILEVYHGCPPVGDSPSPELHLTLLANCLRPPMSDPSGRLPSSPRMQISDHALRTQSALLFFRFV